jgi:DNA-binding response OmpR family regulator
VLIQAGSAEHGSAALAGVGFRPVTDILLATDADWLVDDVEASLGGAHLIHRVRAGVDVVPAIKEVNPALVLLDLQIGNMGGVASCIAVKQQVGMGFLDERPVMLLLDRQVDIFLAKEAGADGWLVKPLDAFGTLRAVERALAGEMTTEEPSTA